MALVVGADVRTWASYRKEEVRTGHKIIKGRSKNFDVIKSSLVATFQDMPANQGAKMVEEVLTGTKEIVAMGLTSLANSFNLTPSQIKKTSKFLQSEGKIIDLLVVAFLIASTTKRLGTGQELQDRRLR